MTSDFETGWFAISTKLQWMPSCLCMPKVSMIWTPQVSICMPNVQN